MNTVDTLAIALSLLAGLGIGSVVAWVLASRIAAQNLNGVQTRLSEVETSLTNTLQRVEGLAAELQQEKVDHATAAADAKRVPDLEFKLAESLANATKLSNEKATADTTAARVPQLEADLKAEQERSKQTANDLSKLRAEIAKDREAFVEKTAALTALRGEIEKEIKNLAGEALKGNEKSFLNLANEVFQKHRETATGDIEQRKKAIESLLAPMATTLDEYRKGLSELEKSRLEAYAGLSTELKGVALAQAEVRTETSRLVNALRAAPKTRGRWGEEQLRNVMELSGMSAYVDFQTEVTFDRDDEKSRPDVIITMPGNRHIVVDAKTSMSAYLEALEVPDDDAKEACLKKHAVQVRSHMKQLSAKSYWDSLTVTPDFVVMFIPGENFFAAAIERDPGLFEDGVKARVLIVTPTTLVALAKAIAFGWRQEKVAENAQKVSDLGRELYKRLATMGEHINLLGTNLDRSVKSYNKFVGSLETSVFPQARKFTELGVEGTQDQLAEIEELETDVRQVRGRDLALAAPEPVTLIEAISDEI